jgi:hypothetical protein
MEKKNMLMRFWKKELPNMTNGWAKAGFHKRQGLFLFSGYETKEERSSGSLRKNT